MHGLPGLNGQIAALVGEVHERGHAEILSDEHTGTMRIVAPVTERMFIASDIPSRKPRIGENEVEGAGGVVTTERLVLL